MVGTLAANRTSARLPELGSVDGLPLMLQTGPRRTVTRAIGGMPRGRKRRRFLRKIAQGRGASPPVDKESSRMAHDSARWPGDTREGQWTRRELMQGLA